MATTAEPQPTTSSQRNDVRYRFVIDMSRGL